MNWQVKIERKAQKALKKIPDPYKSNIIKAIDRLTIDPRADGSTKLKGNSELGVSVRALIGLFIRSKKNSSWFW